MSSEHRGEARIQVVFGDIPGLAVDAIVNAADERMLGGGGVDGAIRRAASRRLLASTAKAWCFGSKE